MKKNKILISVIINCYNGEKYLSQCLQSIVSQSYKNLEIIFWNNRSTDKSEQIVKSFHDRRIRIFRSKKFLSLYEARNQAIKKTRGTYISFLDVDDYWVKDKLEKQVKFLKKNKSYNVIYSNFYTLSKRNKIKNYSNLNLPQGKILNSLIKNYCIGILTVLIKKTIFNKEKFNSRYNIIGDFDFFLRVSLKKEIGCIQEPLAYYRMHDDNYSKKKIKRYISELGSWITKNENYYNNLGFSLNHQKFLLLKLRVKYFIYLIGRVVQW